MNKIKRMTWIVTLTIQVSQITGMKMYKNYQDIESLTNKIESIKRIIDDIEKQKDLSTINMKALEQTVHERIGETKHKKKHNYNTKEVQRKRKYKDIRKYDNDKKYDKDDSKEYSNEWNDEQSKEKDNNENEEEQSSRSTPEQEYEKRIIVKKRYKKTELNPDTEENSYE